MGRDFSPVGGKAALAAKQSLKVKPSLLPKVSTCFLLQIKIFIEHSWAFVGCHFLMKSCLTKVLQNHFVNLENCDAFLDPRLLSLMQRLSIIFFVAANPIFASTDSKGSFEKSLQ